MLLPVLARKMYEIFHAAAGVDFARSLDVLAEVPLR